MARHEWYPRTGISSKPGVAVELKFPPQITVMHPCHGLITIKIKRDLGRYISCRRGCRRAKRRLGRVGWRIGGIKSLTVTRPVAETNSTGCRSLPMACNG